jgi:hypothetical protein
MPSRSIISLRNKSLSVPADTVGTCINATVKFFWISKKPDIGIANLASLQP